MKLLLSAQWGKKKVAVLFRDLHYYGFIILKYLLAFEVIVIRGETI